MGNGFVQPALFSHGFAKIGTGFCEVRFDLQRLSEMGGRFRELTVAVKYPPQVIVCLP